VARRPANLPVREQILLAGFLVLWLVCWGLSARSIIGGARYPALITGRPEHADAYPVVTGFLSWLPGETAGIVVGDRLVRVGGADLRGVTPVGLVPIVVDAARGRHEVPVVFNHDGAEHETSLPVGSMAVLWPSLPSSLAFVLTGVLLLVRARPPTPSTRAVALTLLVNGFTLAVNFIEPGLIHMNLVLRTIAASLVGPIAMRAMFVFMGDAVRPGRLARLAPWLLAFVGPLELVGRLTGWPHLETALLVSGAIVVVAVLVTATYLYRRACPAVRRQARWVFYGLYCALAPASVLFVAATIEPAFMPLVFLARLAAIAVPICIVLAILRYDLFDVDRLISATASYNLVLVIAVAGGLALAPRVSAAAASTLGVDPWLGQTALALVLAGIIVPAHQRLRPILDRRFFPERWATDRGIDRLLLELDHPSAPDALLERCGEGLRRLMHPESCRVFARAGATYAPIFTWPEGDVSSVAGDGPLVAVLRSTGVLALAGRRAEALDPFARAALETLDADVIVPIRGGDDHLAGFVCLASKRSGDVYTPTDLRLLTEVAARASHALARRAQAEVLGESVRMQEALRRYVPGAVAEQLASGRELEAGERDVSVLFVDLRSYTTYAETRQAGEIFSTVNRYTAAASRAIRDRGGSVVEFAGDGMMAVFGAPTPIPDKERAAVAAGEAICRAIAELGTDRAESSPGPLAVGVGVATGWAFVGNVQAVDRAIWTTLGDTVNLAARLQSLTRQLDAAILIDARTWSALDPDSRGRFTRHDAVAIRGRRQPQDVYAIALAQRATDVPPSPRP
jgi:class 3 adenylate cyclase